MSTLSSKVQCKPKHMHQSSLWGTSESTGLTFRACVSDVAAPPPQEGHTWKCLSSREDGFPSASWVESSPLVPSPALHSSPSLTLHIVKAALWGGARYPVEDLASLPTPLWEEQSISLTGIRSTWPQLNMQTVLAWGIVLNTGVERTRSFLVVLICPAAGQTLNHTKSLSDPSYLLFIFSQHLSSSISTLHKN